MPNPTIMPGQTKTFASNTFDYDLSRTAGQWSVGAPVGASNYIGTAQGWTVSGSYGSMTLTCPPTAPIAANVTAVYCVDTGGAGHTDGDGTIVSGPGLLFDIVPPPQSVAFACNNTLGLSAVVTVPLSVGFVCRNTLSLTPDAPASDCGCHWTPGVLPCPGWAGGGGPASVTWTRKRCG